MGIYTKNEETDLFRLQIDETAKSYVLETARWAKFLGIIAIIMVVLASIFMAFLTLYYLPAYTSYASGGMVQYIITVLVVVGIDFYPIFATLKFSALGKKAMTLNNQDALTDSLRYLKNLFKYFGIVTIIIIVLYGVLLIVSVLSSL